MADRFDLVVIGGGPGGYVAALRAAQLGKKVACVEKRKAGYGGTCLNVGCIPSKALLDSSELYALARTKFSKHGIQLSSEVRLDLGTMMGRKDGVVKKSVDGIDYLFKKNKVTAARGAGRLDGPNKVVVTADDGAEQVLETDNVLLATGSESIELPFLKFDGERIVGSSEALAFDKVPEHLIIVGAGYIGLELGSVWARLGSKVSVVEFLPRILPLNDTEIAGLVQKSLAKQGLEFHLGTKVTGADVKGERVTVRAERDGKEVTFEGDRVLVAVGRRPYTDGLGLEAIGVKTEAKTGKVLVDDHFRTSVANVYAIGDLIAGPMLAHKASEEGIAVAETLAGRAGHVNYDLIPSVIYIWPEVASVGKSEDDLKKDGRESGKDYKVGKFQFANSGRARCMDESEGLVKVITDAKTDRIVGVHIFGPRASDMIAEAVTTMEFSGSAEDIARITHAHPTLSEAVAEAAWAAYAGSPLHS